ncbi:unnamed protein product [Rangifer tarandus platyrhynchus]|uniref:Uncharacterized protein n=2 Tax=Rangifer tarandus platyrhynchus TaxID=3082113 RepID=A0ACB0F7T7_RANTA|nr:unnamed protein product [Rangifer tarandus platyrhynchus]CAI9708141.1 unnamed protein product [Rangifer tarandus platyrhynchus]
MARESLLFASPQVTWVTGASRVVTPCGGVNRILGSPDPRVRAGACCSWEPGSSRIYSFVTCTGLGSRVGASGLVASGPGGPGNQATAAGMWSSWVLRLPEHRGARTMVYAEPFPAPWTSF